MESPLSNKKVDIKSIARRVFTSVETHGFTVNKHVNWDDFNWVAITPIGSVVVFRDRIDNMIYAIYGNYKGRYHVHIPLVDDIYTLDEKANDVLKEVWNCVRYAQCYIDRTTKEYDMIYNINPLLLRGFTPVGLGQYKSKFEKENG
jgi:hypothetical protein